MALVALMAGCDGASVDASSSLADGVLADSALGSTDACATYSGLPAGWGEQARAGMVLVPGGSFTPGTLHGLPEERPAGSVELAPFWVDRTEVTNAQFSAFVAATGYVTEAEREGGAAVFQAPVPGTRGGAASWWRYQPGADWRHPEGPGSNLDGRDNQPVVQVTHADALAYARWLGRELPSEAQWEFAARAGGEAERIEREPRDADGCPLANFWQGEFPFMNSREDGFVDRAPVGCYPANGYGLHDLIGNVWEWTTDPFTGPRQPHGHGDAGDSRPGAGAEPVAELDPNHAAHTESSPLPELAPVLVIKGGSFLCAANYCQRYRATARHPQERDLGTAHVGFRTILPQ